MESMKTNKYTVQMEEHWDFYKNPSERPILGIFDTYQEAVEFAKKIIIDD